MTLGMPAWLGERLLASVHPARLPVALVDTVCVFAASFLASAIAAWAGVAAGMLPAILGGLLCFNLLLFLPPGGLTSGPARVIAALLTNLVPAAVGFLYAQSAIAAELLLIVVTGSSVLARRYGALPGTLGLMAAINTMAALILSMAPNLPVNAAIAGLVAVPVALAGDAIGSRLAARYGAASARGLVDAQLADFIDTLAEAWDRPDIPWPASTLTTQIARMRATLADFAALPTMRGGLPIPGDAMLVPHHLLDSIVRSLGKLQALRPEMPVQYAQMTAEMLHALREAARQGDLTRARDAVLSFRDAAAEAPLAGERGQPVMLLGLALQCADLVESAASVRAAPPPVRPNRPGFRALLSAIEGRVAVQAMVSVALALLVAHLLPLARPYWVPLTALILTTGSFGENLRKSADRIVGTAFGLLLGQAIWMAAGDRTLLIDAGIAVSVFGIYFSRTARYAIVLFWLSVLISIVLHIAGGSATVYVGRFIDTLIGAGIVLLVTVIIMPVRTGAAARARIAGLLNEIATGLSGIVARLDENGPHARTGAAERAATAAGELHALAEAEWLEAGVLHTQRVLIAERVQAVERSVQFLLFLDELLPALSGCQPDTRALIADLADIARKAAAAVGTGGAMKEMLPPERFHATDDAALAVFRAGGMSIGQLHAERRVVRILHGLHDAVQTLAGTSLATPPLRTDGQRAAAIQVAGKSL